MTGPRNAEVKFFFTRHLERSAAQKHGAAGGLAAVIRKRADAQAAKDAEAQVERVRRLCNVVLHRSDAPSLFASGCCQVAA